MAVMPVNLNTQLAGAREKADIFPADVSPRLYGDQTHPTLFSFVTGDIISAVANAPSPLMDWLPSRGVTWWNEPIGHLSWVAPENFDGSESYAEYLASMPEVEECDFADGTKYQICEYVHTMGRISGSTKNEPIKTESIGVRLYEKMPQQILRGNDAGITISNDRDWSLARLGMMMQEHQNWNIVYGSEGAYSNTYDGLNEIVQTGWVKSHARGKGSCDFTDPIVVNGVSLSTNEEILRRIKRVYMKIRKRMMQRGYTPKGDDIVILMNDTMWEYLADTLAYQVLDTNITPDNITLFATADAVAAERARLGQGGAGYGYIRIGSNLVPVLPDTRIGANTTINGNPAVTGDIFILSKRFHGMTIMEHLYLDWAQMGPASPLPLQNAYPTGAYRPVFFQNGMLRVTTQPLTGNFLCWYYGAEMYGMIVTYMNALQGRINDVTILTDTAGENESASFTSPDFYAFNGTQGGAGTALLEDLT